MFRLDNRIAVVIGGAGGIGEACATAMARQGARIVIADMNIEKAITVADRIKSVIGAETMAMSVDVSKEESLKGLADQATAQFGTVDILVNSQGYNVKMPGDDINLVAWNSMFGINVTGVALSCQTFGRIMIEKRQGKIINLSSVRGIRAADGGNVAYGATKGSVDMITRVLAVEWAQYNVMSMPSVRRW
jgi:NAD(P)-dependent dehydrogenase (short-subunit alcohol dehydrogenase family)